MADHHPPVGQLPSDDNQVLRDSSFFKDNPVDLPSPEEVRQKDRELHGDCHPMSRRPPIPFEELGLIVKYGFEITIAEAQCLWYFNKHMKDQVPTPELFGWCRAGGQTYIYMQLVRGQTMEEAWPSLSEQEKTLICEQLRGYAASWQALCQESEPYYIGEQMTISYMSSGYNTDT